MIHTLAFCCAEQNKQAYFNMIWEWCAACHKVPALYHFEDTESFWARTAEDPVEGVIILFPETQGKLFFEELKKRRPNVKALCFCTLERPGVFSKERVLFPTPLTQERLEQALAWFDIVPAARGDFSRRVFTAPGCLTPESMVLTANLYGY